MSITFDRVPTALGFTEIRAASRRIKAGIQQLESGQLSFTEIRAVSKQIKADVALLEGYKANKGSHDADAPTGKNPYDGHIDTRPDTTPAQRDLGRRGLMALAGRINHLSSTHGANGGVQMLGNRLYAGFTENGHVTLAGQTIADSADLAALSQVYRDGRFETLRLVYVDASNRVVGESAYSSRLPGVVSFAPGNGVYDSIEADKSAFGAAGYWILHNHPSGRSMPSPADVAFTTGAAQAVAGFMGHVVIDHQEFSIIDENGTAATVSLEADQAGPDLNGNPTAPHPLLGLPISNPAELVTAAKQVTDSAHEATVVILCNTKNEAHLVFSAPHELLAIQPGDTQHAVRLEAWLRGLGKKTGAGGAIFLVMPNTETALDAGKDLIRRGLVTDVTTQDGAVKSLREQGIKPEVDTGLFDPRRTAMKLTLPANEGSLSEPGPDDAVDESETESPRKPTSHLYDYDPNRKKSQRKAENQAAMSLLAQIDAGEIDSSALTDDQKAVLARYSGTGGAMIGADGKKGSKYEYYTPKPIAEGMWNLARDLGFSGGKVLDPCAGVGIFGATAPLDAAVDAVELNTTSGRINGLINNGPGYTTTIAPFEQVAQATPDEQYDCIMTNVPFGDVADRGGNQLLDRRYQKQPLQNYFILRTLEKLKPGGLAIYITPPRCVSGKDAKEKDLRVRASYMAEFMGAYRLPNSVFGTADADTMTDVIVFRKYSTEALDKIAELREQNPGALVEANVQWQPFIEGAYFLGEGKRYVLGEFQPKDPEKFRDVDRVINKAPVGEIGQMLRKFESGSRVNWDMLNTVETRPIVYQDGDTIYQAGETLKMENGRWVAMAQSANQNQALQQLNRLRDPYSAFENGVKWREASEWMDYMAQTGQAIYVPAWVAESVRTLSHLDSDAQEKFWTAGVVGLAVAQILDERLGEDPAARLHQEFAALSSAMQTHWSVAKQRPGAIGGILKNAMGQLLNHFDKKRGFSAVWRGDVQEQPITPALEQGPDVAFETLRYQLRSPWVPIDQAKAIYGDDFDPFASSDWCISADGASCTKAGDYYVGNYQSLLSRLDDEIAQAPDDLTKNKLIRQKFDADQHVSRVDPRSMNFNLFSPLITPEEKAEFLRRFVDPRAYVAIDDDTGNKYVDFDVTGSNLTDSDKLLKRLGRYLSKGTITLGGAKLSMSDKEAIEYLRRKVNVANEQIDGYVKANPKIMARLEAKANDPAGLRLKPAPDVTPLPIAGMNPELKLHSYQTSFVRQMGRGFEGINGFNVGLGKAQPLDAKILTPNGWKRMGDIMVGDLVIAVDGTAVPVTGVYPQGEKEIFEVEFSDGAKTRCCDEHLWFTETEKDRQNQRYNNLNGTGRQYPGSVKSLNEIRNTLIYGKKKTNHKIPIVKPILFRNKELKIHPYLMGILLGDGNFSYASTAFTTVDAEIATRVARLVNEGFDGKASVVARKVKDRAQSYGISRCNNKLSNPVRQELNRYGLCGARSHTKFIPDEYMLGSVEQRISLLQGLMDSDGYVSKDGITVQFTSCSILLAKGVVEIVRSLGGIAWIRSKIPNFTKGANRFNGRESFTVSMRMPSDINPFLLERKAARVLPKSKYIPVRYFVGVKSVGKELAKCISIDHPTHLYVTDDYIVTHNTYTALAAMQYVQSIGIKRKTLIVVPNSVLSNWRKEAGRAYSNLDDCLFVGLRIDKNGKPVVSSGNYDADLTAIMENRHSKIFLTYEALERIRLKSDTVGRYIDHLMSVDASFAESDDKAADERKKTARGTMEQALTEKSGSAPYLEDMGVDSIIIDEAHNFKNSAQTKEFKSAKYLSLAPASRRGLDAQAKCWYIRGSSASNDGVLLLTATPITNSPLEIYSMLSLAVGRDRVNQACLGIQGADHFMELMCDKINENDMSIDGVERSIDVFVGLKNVDMLRKILGENAAIEDAKSVGSQIVVPDQDDYPTSIALPDSIKKRLQDYKGAFRFAIDTIQERGENRGDPMAYERVEEHFDEPMELIAHPFNLINKMTLLIADPELDNKATYFTIDPDQADIAKRVIEQFNAKKITEKRPRPGPETDQTTAILAKKQIKDEEDGKIRNEYSIHVRAVLRDNRIVLDTMDSDAQTTFETLAEKAGLSLDVTIPPKLAALIENFSKEAASPRGMDAAGNASPIVKQIIFCDILPLHNKIKRVLAQKCGVPSSAIAIITGRTNNEPDEIMAVQEGFNASGGDNRYRCIIANEKAEVGINLQIGTQAIHHLTIGWTPDSLVQRNGRGVRQGNKTPRVSVYFYDADGTFDMAKREMVSAKSQWIDSVTDLKGGGKIKIEGGLSKEQMEALVDSVGDADGMARVRAEMAAKAAAQRTQATLERQQVNLATVKKQRDFLLQFKEGADYVAGFMLDYWTQQQQAAKLAEKAKKSKKAQAAYDAAQERLAGMRARLAETGLDMESLKYWPTNYRGKARDRADALSYATREINQLPDITGSSLYSEWQNEYQLAQQMMDEAAASFKSRSDDEGALPTSVVEAIKNGEAVELGGEWLFPGVFLTDSRGGLNLFTQKFPGYRGEVAFVGARDDRIYGWRASADSLSPSDFTLIYPGAAGYDDCLTRAAQIEDSIMERGKAVENGFSDHLPAVAERLKAEKLTAYNVHHGFLLPSPYFPIPMLPRDTPSPLMQSIIEHQSKFIRRWDGNTFVLPASAALSKGRVSDLQRIELLRDWALAHHVKASQTNDFPFAPTLNLLLNKTALVGQINGDTPEARTASLNAAVAEQFAWIEFDGRLPVDCFGLLDENDLMAAVYQIGDDPAKQWLLRQMKRVGTDMARLDELDQALRTAKPGWLTFNPIAKRPPYWNITDMAELERIESIVSITGALRSQNDPVLDPYYPGGRLSAPTDPEASIFITGNTYPHKDAIKLYAGLAGATIKWDGQNKAWKTQLKTWHALIKARPELEKELQLNPA